MHIEAFDYSNIYFPVYTSAGVKISGYVTQKSNTYILYHNSSRCYVEKNGQAGYTLPTLYKLSE